MTMNNSVETFSIKNDKPTNETNKLIDNVPNEDLNEIKPKRKKSSRSIRSFKNIVKILLSNIMFVIAVILYSSIGAFVFQILEQHEEIRLCEEGKVKFEIELKRFRENFINYVTYNISDEEYQKAAYYSNSSMYLYNSDFGQSSSNLSSLYEEDKFIIFDRLLNDFKQIVLDIESQTRYVGQDCIEDSRWTFYSALLFTISIMSSVGYGNVSPLTWEGKVVTICYATIGIPIFGICLINLSSSLGSLFRFVYAEINSINPMKKYLKYFRKYRRERIMQKKLKKKLKQLKENQSYTELDSNAPAEEFQVELKGDSSENQLQVGSDDNNDIQILSISYDSSDSDVERENDEENMNDNEVPMSVTILFFIFYVTVGALIFMRFEDWSFVQSVYFVYVTLSTMGFGDFVPGTKLSKGQNAKLLTVCLYSFLGMAIMAMSYNVMQSTAKKSIQKLVKNLKTFVTCGRNKIKNNAELVNEEREATLEISQNLRDLHRCESSLRRKKIKPKEID